MKLVNNFKPVNILEPGGGGGQACMQTTPVIQIHTEEEGGPGGLSNLMK